MAENNLDAMLTAATWEGRSGAEVRQFLQRFLQRQQSGKVGTHRMTKSDDHTVTIRSFADDAAAAQWEAASDTDKVSNPEITALVLGQISFKEGTDQTGYTMSAKLKTAPTATIVRGESCIIGFTYDCTYSDGTPDTESGRVIVQINGSNVAELTRDLAPDPNKEVQIDFGKYLTSDTNSVKIIVTNKYDGIRTFAYTIKTVQVKLSLESYTEDVLRGTDAWALRVRNLGNTCKAHVKLDNTELTALSIGAGSSMAFTIPANTPAGGHTLRVWGVIEEYNLSSTPIVVHFIKAGNVPAICIGAEATTSLQHYGDINVPFFLYYPYGESDTKSVRYRVEDANGNVLVSEKTLSVALNADRTSGMQQLQISTIDDAFRGNDSVKVILAISHNGGEYTAEHDVTLTSAGIDLVQTPQHDVHFAASGHNNTDADRTSWLSLGEGVTASLKLSDNFILGSGTGFSNGAFVIPRGKTLTLDAYKPFVADVGANNPAGGSGKTIEVELRIRNCTNTGASILRCMDDGKGFEVFANRAVLSSTSGKVETPFSDDVRIRIGFVVEGSTRMCTNKVPNKEPEISYKNIAYIYANGVPVRIMEYATDSWAQSTPQCIEIGSTDADVELYTIRTYSRALTFRDMINNFAYDTPVLADKIAVAKRNAIFDNAGEVDFQLVQTALPNTPHKVWEFAEMPQGKKDWKKCTTQFINPQFDPLGTDKANAPFTCVNHDFALDGTSSLSYPDPYKNWADKYNGAWKLNIGNTEITISGYSITEGVAGMAVEFVDKVNFASSEGILNILAANMYHDILVKTAKSRPTLLTPPQAAQYEGAAGAVENTDNVTYRQSLSGYPIIGWRKVDNNGIAHNEFLSIYNFVNNKYDPYYFGFDNSGAVEAWEVEDNLNIFAQPLVEGAFEDGKWNGNATSLYYCRFPKNSPTTKGATYGVPSTESAEGIAVAKNETSKIRRFHNWVYSCNPHVAERYKLANGNYKQLDAAVTYGSTRYTHDTPAYRKQKFLAEYRKYINKDSALFYFVFFDFFLGVDSFEKNMTTTFINKAVDGEVLPLAHFMPRDSDTGMMYGNTGLLKFGVHNEWGDSINDVTGETGRVTGETYANGNYALATTTGTPVYNGRLSGLWDVISEVWKSDIEDMYTAMRSNGLTAASFWAKANSFWSQWCEGLYCADAMGYVNTGRVEMAHGDKKEVIRYFLNYRQRYMDSKYKADTSTPMELRLWGSSAGFAVRYARPMYASMKFGAGGIETQRAIIPEQPAYFGTGGVQFSETTVTAYNADLITELSTYSMDDNGVRTEEGLQGTFGDVEITTIANCKLLKKLCVDFSGREASTRMDGKVLKVGNSIALEELTIRNCPAVTGSIAFASQAIRKVDLRDTGVSGITLQGGSPIQSLKLGSRLTSLSLVDLPELAEASVQGFGSMESLTIKACPMMSAATEGKNAMQMLVEALLSSGATKLKSLTLDGVDFKNFSTANLRVLLSIPNVSIKGVISMSVASNGEGRISYEDKLALTSRFGDVDKGEKGLRIVYGAVAFTSATYNGNRYVANVGTYRQAITPNSVNANSMRSVRWEIDTNDYATITPEGVLTVTAVDVEANASAAQAQLRCVISNYGVTSGNINTDVVNEVVVAHTIKFYDRVCRAGDYLYSDGSTGDEANTGRSVVGIVFWVSDSDPKQRLAMALKDVSGGTSWGLHGSHSGSATSDNTTVNIAPLSDDPTYNCYRENITDAGNDPGVCDFFELTADLETGKPPRTYGRHTKVGERISRGYANTIKIIEHRNKILGDSNFNRLLRIPIEKSTATKTALADLNACLLDVRTALDPVSQRNKFEQIYYPAASMCYAYEPSVKAGEELAEHLKATNWHLMSRGELQCLTTLRHNTGYNGDQGIFNKASVDKLLDHGNWNNRWSSSEYGINAWVYTTYSGAGDNVHRLDRYDRQGVRPVIAF